MNNKLIPIAIIIVGVLIAGVIVYTNYQKPLEAEQGKLLSSQEAGEKLINFINNNILQEQTKASLIEAVEENGLYKVKFDVEGEEVEWHITKDGEIILPQAIDLTEVEAETGSDQPASLEEFAKCLTEKGMKFYGAEWCSWCKKEKELFAEAVQYLPYIECVDEESDELTAECQEAGISSFPTWQLPNGELVSGFKTLEELSELSGCSIQ